CPGFERRRGLMLVRNVALRLVFFTLLILPSAGRLLAADFEPQDVRSTPPSRVLQTAPARTAQMQVCVREVPDLSRSNAGSAGAVLSKFDLALGSTQLQKSTAPRGTIVGQSVKPGTQVRCGTRIDLSVSDGTPDIRQTGPGGIDVRRPVPSGTSDGPPTNSDHNSRRPIPPDVDVRPFPGGIDRQPPPVDCPAPTLTNHSYVEVGERLRGWTIGRIERVETRAAQEGTILKQAPAPRTMVKCNSSIDIAIALPPPNVDPQPPFDPAQGGPERGRGAPVECPAPTLTNYSYAEVRERLRGWTIGRVEKVETRTAQEGTILQQSPAPRTMVKCNSSIDIAIATAPPCVVPGIGSGDVADGRQALARRNLVLGRVNRRPSEKPPGIVIGQHPAPETTIACGSTVDVWIAEPLPLIHAPPLQGQDVATARRTLESLGLVLGTAERRESELPVGGVVDQLPL